MSLESIGLGGLLSFNSGNTIPQMGRVGAAFSRLTESAGVLGGGLKKIGGALTSAGAALTPVALGFGLATKRAADFDQKMADIKAASPDLTKGALAEIEKKAKSLGASTVFSAGEAADAFLGLTKAGLTAAQASKAVEGVLAGAAAEGMGLAEATDIVVKSMGAFSLKAEDAGFVADVLAQASAASTSSMSELGFGMKFVGGTANTLGISLSDTAAALATVTNAGIDGSTAGTALNGMLTELVDPSKKARDILGMLGVKLTDANGKFRDIAAIVPELSANLSRFRNPAERTQAIIQLFGKEGARAFNALDASLKQPGQSIIDITAKLKGAQGAAKRMADTRLDSFNGSIEKLKGNAETLLLEVFQPILPIVRKNIERLGGVVDTISTRFQNLSRIAKATLAKVGAGVAVALAVGVPLLGALAAIGFFIGNVIVPAVSGLATVFGVLLSPIILKVAAIVGVLALAWYLFGDQIKAFGRGFMDSFGPTIEALKEMWTILTDTVKRSWQDVVDIFRTSSGGMAVDFKKVGSVIATVVSFIVTMLIPVVKILAAAFELVVIGVAGLARVLWAVLKPVIDVISQTVGQVVLAFDELFSGDITTAMMRFGALLIDLVLLPLRNILKVAIAMGDALGVKAPEGLRKFAEGGLASLIPTKPAEISAAASGPLPAFTTTIGSKIDQMHETLKNQKEKPINVQSNLKVDGRELALASGRHQQEINERGGFKVPPYQRRLAVAMGGMPLKG